MNFISNLKIGTRLGAAFGTLLLLIAAVAAIGAANVDLVHDGVKTIYEDRTIPLQQLGEINRLMMRDRVLVMDMMAHPEPANIEKRDTELRTNLDKVSKLWEAVMATSLTPDEKVLAAEFIAASTAYVKDGLLAARDAIRAGKPDEAARLYKTAISPLAPKAHAPLDKLLQLQVDEAQKEYKAASALEVRVYVVMTAITAAALLLGGWLAWSIARSITRPINQAVKVAQTVAAGDLSSKVEVTSRDETGQLLAALKAMNESLAGIVGNVRQSSDSIATGSAQIATGNADLSQRTEEQASNLEQTAASMEELTSTVKHNADTARQANQLATSASEAAAKGGVVVGQVVGTMQDISASSRKIADIISVIDGIAFQTNILALNAAVEAARAGEQGRGFAVVASEVRSLAQRSANAAKEIKTLIGESVEKVETGSKLVDDAGKSMEDIVSQVKRVTDLIAEISSASVEQTQGISQVGDAVNQLDQMTQQNAALVEQSAAAADSLSQQAAQLAEVVAVFKLNAGDSHSTLGAVAPTRQVVERRGPHRATNVTRPRFAAKASSDSAPAKASGVQTAAARTGTDDWEQF